MNAIAARKKPRRYRVLVVDDAALVRKLLAEGLGKHPQLEVIGTAPDPYAARDILVRERPDVITLDVEMPKMDGVTFLKHIMARMPTPVVMVSSLTGPGKKLTVEALEAGAIDVVLKPKGIVAGLPAMMENLQRAVVTAAGAKVRARGDRSTLAKPSRVSVAPAALAESSDKVIAIGSSTGGVEALARILPTLPAAAPGVVICQHMPAGFTRSFAERLDRLCAISVKEAEDGDRVRPGLALLAPGGNMHMRVKRFGGEYRVKLSEGDLVSGHRPSVDVLFSSVAASVGGNAAAAILTGMGSDGAKGMLEMRSAGARCFAQDEATCVIYGMPGSAMKLGAAEAALPLEKIPNALMKSVVQRFSSF